MNPENRTQSMLRGNNREIAKIEETYYMKEAFHIAKWMNKKKEEKIKLPREKLGNLSVHSGRKCTLKLY